MKFSCDKCGARFQVADDKIGPSGAKTRCPKCSETIFLSAPGSDEPPPASEASPEGEGLDVATGLPEGTSDAEGSRKVEDADGADAGGTREGEDADGTSDAEGPREVEDADVAVAPEAPSSAAAADEAPEAFTAPSAEPPPPDEPEASAEEAPSSAFDGAEAGGDDEGAEGLAGLEERDELLEMQTSLQEELANDLDLGPEADRHDPGRVAVELGSAFEQMFSAEAIASDRTPVPSEDAPAMTDSAPAEAPPEAVWFVAVREEQVGPLSRPELEARWSARELTAGSLAWREGQSDWLPIGEIEDLNDLPDMKARRREVSEDLSYEGLPQLAPAARRTPALAPREDSAARWKPSAAAALDSLAEEELAESSAPEAAPSPFSLGPEPASSPPLSGPAASGPFGPSTEPVAPALSSSGGPVALPPPPRSRGPWLWAVPLILVALAGGAGAAVLISRSGGDTAPESPVAGIEAPSGAAEARALAPVAADAGVADAASEDARALEAGVAAGLAAVDAGVADAAAPDAQAKVAAAPKTKSTRPRTQTQRRTNTTSRRRVRKTTEDDLLGSGGGGSRTARNLPEKPSGAAIKNVLIEHKSDVLRCLSEQRRADPSLQGQLTVKMSLQGDGRPRRVNVVPAQFRDAPVGRCLIRSVRTWRFPQFSGSPVPVDFPVIVRGG